MVIITDKIAYYLGFLAADGWISNSGLGFALKRSDRDNVEYIASITEEIMKSFGIDKEIAIKDYDAKSKGKLYPASRFHVCSKILVQWLSTYGIVPSKSHKDINFLKNIPKENKIAFIFGYFDGDGCFSFNENTRDVNLSIVGRKIMMDSIKETLFEILNIDLHVYPIKNSLTYQVASGKTSTILTFINRYADFSNEYFVLQRKLNLIINFKISNGKYIKKIRNTYKSPIQGYNICPNCGNLKKQSSCLCSNCNINDSQSHIISKEKLEELYKTNSFEKIAKIYNVSGNTVANWFKHHKIYKPVLYKNIVSDIDIAKVYLQNLSAIETARELNLKQEKVHYSLKNIFGEKYKVFLAKYSFIKSDDGIIYPNKSMAARYLGSPNCEHHISECLINKRKTAFGHTWTQSNIDEYITYLKNSNNKSEQANTYKELLNIVNNLLK